VHYPGLASHPGHAIAARQMKAFGGMLSFGVRRARCEALGVPGRRELVTGATSLGGPESLIEHRASVEGAHTRAPEGLLRMSVGLEHPDDVIADLARALEAAGFGRCTAWPCSSTTSTAPSGSTVTISDCR